MSIENETTDELSLLDILDFLREEARMILATAGAATLLGLAAAFVLPEKFIGSALLEPAKVLGNAIEPPAVLAEKMRSPTYYAAPTLAACGFAGKRNAAQEFVKELGPKVGRQSAFVAVDVKLASTDLVRQCLNAVVDDVKKEQALLATQQIAVAKERLKREQEKLAVAENFMNSLSGKTVSQLRNSVGSDVTGSTLVFVAMQAKQIEIAGIKSSIDTLSMQLAEPQTKPAGLAVPMDIPEVKVEPRRAMITAASLAAGLFLGLLVAVARRALRRARPARGLPRA
ncbi:MAG: hypothetical protein WCI59_17250 [Betaproteobacteria bacterium]